MLILSNSVSVVACRLCLSLAGPVLCVFRVCASWCRFSGLPGAYPAVVRALGGRDERGLQQGAALKVSAPGRRRLEGPPRRRLQGMIMMHMAPLYCYVVVSMVFDVPSLFS